MFENKLQVLSSLKNIPNNKFGMLKFEVRVRGDPDRTVRAPMGANEMRARPTRPCGERTCTMMVGPIGEAFVPPPRRACPS
jgi:hypothetical protein